MALRITTAFLPVYDKHKVSMDQRKRLNTCELALHETPSAANFGRLPLSTANSDIRILKRDVFETRASLVSRVSELSLFVVSPFSAML